MRKLLALLALFASGLLAQTMILTPSYIATLKTRAAANSAEWQILRGTAGIGCDAIVQYTANTPDHLPPVTASGENATEGYNEIIRIGTDMNAYQGTAAMVAGMPAAACYLILKDGDVTPSGWSYTWNGTSLTAQQYGILAGIQAVKILNKTTPSFAKITPASPPNNWGGFPWRMVGGVGYARYNRLGWGNQTFGSVDAYTLNTVTSAPTSAGSNVLYFTNTSNFTAGHVAIGTNIPAGTTISTITPNASIALSANVTGSGVATGALISDTPAGNNCSAAGQVPVFVGLGPNSLAAHSAIVLSDLLGPVGTALNGNTYYVSATGYSSPYGFELDTTSGGGTLVCATPMQGTDYKGNPVGSGENYNHNPQNDNEYPDRFFLSGMGLLYDWLHPLINQSVPAALNQLAALEPSAVTNTFTAGGTAWNASTNPWTASNYPQAIPTNYSTLEAQVLDSMDAWIRDLFAGYYSANDVGTLAQVGSNYHWGHYAGTGLAAIAVCHGSSGCASPDDARASVWYDWWRNYLHMAISQPYTQRWFGPNGNQMDSFNYLPQAVEGITLALASNITALGDDLITNSAQPFPWIVGVEFYKHNLEPNGRSMLTRGYGFSCGGTPCTVNGFDTESLMPVQYLADLENIPLKNQFRSFVQGIITANGEGGANNPAEPFLFWDPGATQTAWTSEPTVLGNLANPAGGYGHVYMRSDWTSGAVYADFAARPYDFDAGNGHDEWDQAGSMMLQRGNNTLLVHPSTECQRENPVTQAGAGAAMFSNAYNCWDAIGGGVGPGGGTYGLDATVGAPSTTNSPDSLALTTSAATSSGAVLTFTSTTGVSVGTIAIGTNIPANAFVLRLTSTTVTLNQNVAGGGVGSGASITFATVGSINSWWFPQGNTPQRSYNWASPGDYGGNPPVCTAAGSPFVFGLAYSVSGSTVTVTPTAPLTTGWANGMPVMFSWASGATPPTYYLSGSSGATESMQPGTLYVIINWNSSGTFGIVKAPTNVGYFQAGNGGYPTTGTALVFATTGSGTNRIHGGAGCTGSTYGSTPGVAEAHPARVDLLESTSSYGYARGVGLEGDYYGNPAWAGWPYGGRVIASQREVLYITPKLFLVYDRTRQNHWNQQALTFDSLVDTDGTNPAYAVVNQGFANAVKAFHTGMQVKITGCANTTVNNNTYTITVLDGNRFALNGVTSSIGTPLTGGTATGNIWGHQVIPWHTSAKPVEVTTGGQATAGMRQWHVKAPAVNIASISNTTPVTITTNAPHNLNPGMTINVAGVTGACAGLNGTWVAMVPTDGAARDLVTLTLTGSTACGAVGAVGTIQKFNGAITTIKPATPPAVLQDMILAAGQGTLSGSGYIYNLMVHDPRDCTSNPTWCLASGADAADSQNWLTVLDASQSAADTATLTPLTSTNADMVQVGTGTVAGFQNAQVAAGNCANSTCTPPAPVLPISYSFTQGTGIVNHYLAGVTPGATYYVNASTPGSVTISSTGSAGATQASANGILSFTTQNGVGTTVTTISGFLQIKGNGSVR